MRKIGPNFCAAFAGLVLAVGLTLPAAAEKRVALIIGNDKYVQIPALQKAVNDARTIGETLKSIGFSVTVAENLTRRAMSERLLAFDKSVGPGDTALFFFAGHGFEIKGENYLLPTDVPGATEGQEELVRDASFAAPRIIDRLQARGVRTAILVLDACRNNPFERPGTRAVGGTGGLAAMTPAEGVFVVFSAGAKQTALDRLNDKDTDPNSVFTRHFVRELKTPGQTLVQIAKRTQSEVKVMAASIRHVQTPAYYDQVVGDVVLYGKAAGPAAPLPQIAAIPPTAPAPRPSTPDPASSDPVNAPLANFTRHNSGWSITLSFPDVASAIAWRLGESGDFKETGFLDVLDPRTRKRMANPSIQLDSDAPSGTIYVRYADARGDWQGPFPIRFDPNAALERDQRRTLEMTASSWLSFREFNGLLVYYTHLMSYRCAIRAVKIGVDSTMPDRTLQLPPCDPRNPSAIPSSAQPYLKLPPATKSVSIELTYRDGSVSEIKNFRR
jgi:hypothetical protein